LTAIPVVELRPENTMKIASYSDTLTQIVGRRCDRCGRCVRLQAEVPGGRSAVSLGAELSRFVSVDLDHGDKLHRADLCEPCSSKLLERIREFLPAFREIATDDPASGIRTFSYRMIDMKTNRAFRVSSLFDEGA